jgi:peptidoglycan lytic transglycosylase
MRYCRSVGKVRGSRMANRIGRVSAVAVFPARAFVLAMSALAIGAAHEAADAREPAPITFAGQGGGAQSYDTAALGANLAGGGADSYGYGAARADAPRASVVDLRVRNADAAPAQRADGQGAQPWLERERVGPPYEANGQWYVPTPEPGYSETGRASWYGPDFHGRATASGEPFDQTALTAAHPTLPIPSLVQVTNLENGREAILRVNDRGPFVDGRLIDVSRAAADVLGFEQAGGARVNVRYLGPAPRHVLAEGAAPAAPAAAQAAVYAAPAPAAASAAAPQNGPISLLPPADQQPVQQAAPAPAYTPVAYAAPSYAPTAAGSYVVQVGAYADAANAEHVREAVENAGPVAVDTRMTARGALHRVRVGPFESRAEAEGAQRRLASLGFADAIVAAR